MYTILFQTRSATYQLRTAEVRMAAAAQVASADSTLTQRLENASPSSFPDAMAMKTISRLWKIVRLGANLTSATW
jgi:hypothetical protein